MRKFIPMIMVAVACVLVFAPQPARAAWTEYYDRTAWQTALTGAFVVENVDTVSSTIPLTSTPYTIGTLSYTAVSGSPAFVVAGNVNGTACLTWSGTTGGILYTRVDLPGSYNGVGVDYYASAISEDSDGRPHNSYYFRVTGTSGVWTSPYLPDNGHLVNDGDEGRPTSGFYGVIDSLGGIASFQVGTYWTNWQSFGADNFSYGPTAVAKLEATPAGGALLDFGNVPQGTIGLKYSAVTLKNIGAPGTTIQLSGAEFSDLLFSIAPSPPPNGNANASLGQNVSETFTLQFNAVGAALGEYTASVTFHNDSLQGDVTYDLTARVVAIPEAGGLGLMGVALLALSKRRS